MRKIFVIAVMLLAMEATAQTYETHYERSVSDVMADIQQRFGVVSSMDRICFCCNSSR